MLLAANLPDMVSGDMLAALLDQAHALAAALIACANKKKLIKS